MGAERFALVILDGLGDRPHPDTGGVSPIEAAATPNLDALVARGTIGRVTVVGPGVAPESDAGVFALLGYDPVTDSPGRGVLEALGVGIELGPGDVAFRLNFATVDGTGGIVDSRVGRSLTTEQSRSLADALSRSDLLADEGIRAEVRATVGHRGVLWLHPTDGRALSSAVSNSDPFYEKVGGMGQARRVTDPRPLPVRALEPTPGAERTAAAVDRFLARAAPVLAAHTVNARRAIAGQKVANGLLVRNAGGISGPPPASFRERYAVEGVAVTEMPVERGIARCLKLGDRFVGPMGRDRDAALAERARVTLAALQESPFVYVHLKGPDEPGHDGDARAKRDVVEALDRAFFGPFVAGADWATTRLAVTADHATPCILKGHSDDPVPLLLVGAGVPAAPPAGKFGEALAARGALGDHRGVEVLDLLFGRPATSR
jgi:2,3-bisphosphoglycerate-independent phosphoglycerate mutase